MFLETGKEMKVAGQICICLFFSSSRSIFIMLI